MYRDSGDGLRVIPQFPPLSLIIIVKNSYFLEQRFPPFYSKEQNIQSSRVHAFEAQPLRVCYSREKIEIFSLSTGAMPESEERPPWTDSCIPKLAGNQPILGLSLAFCSGAYMASSRQAASASLHITLHLRFILAALRSTALISDQTIP